MILSPSPKTIRSNEGGPRGEDFNCPLNIFPLRRQVAPFLSVPCRLSPPVHVNHTQRARRASPQMSSSSLDPAAGPPRTDDLGRVDSILISAACLTSVSALAIGLRFYVRV